VTCTTTLTPLRLLFSSGHRSLTPLGLLPLRSDPASLARRAVVRPTYAVRSSLLSPTRYAPYPYHAPRFGRVPRRSLPLVAPRAVLAALAGGGARVRRWCSCAAASHRLRPDGWNLLAQASSPLCCRCMFQVFQLFQRYVAVVSYGYCKSRSGMLYILQCCKCFRGMLQVFVQNVSSIADICCKRFLSECLHMFHTYVATICSICFRRCCKCSVSMLHML
jgi:hypothetical protein